MWGTQKDCLEQSLPMCIGILTFKSTFTIQIKKGPKGPFYYFGGERGIRTPGRFPVNGFQARQEGIDL